MKNRQRRMVSAALAGLTVVSLSIPVFGASMPDAKSGPEQGVEDAQKESFYVFLDEKKGADANDGLTAEKAVKTLAKAEEIAKSRKEGTEAVIVRCGAENSKEKQSAAVNAEAVPSAEAAQTEFAEPVSAAEAQNESETAVSAAEPVNAEAAQSGAFETGSTAQSAAPGEAQTVQSAPAEETEAVQGMQPDAAAGTEVPENIAVISLTEYEALQNVQMLAENAADASVPAVSFTEPDAEPDAAVLPEQPVAPAAAQQDAVADPIETAVTADLIETAVTADPIEAAVTAEDAVETAVSAADQAEAAAEAAINETTSANSSDIPGETADPVLPAVVSPIPPQTEAIPESAAVMAEEVQIPAVPMPVPAPEYAEETAEVVLLTTETETAEADSEVIVLALPGRDLVGGGTTRTTPVSAPQNTSAGSTGAAASAGNAASAGSAGTGTVTPPSSGKVQTTPVNTGDEMKYLPYLLCAVISGIAWLLFNKLNLDGRRRCKSSVYAEEMEAFRRACAAD